ncbi:MAG: ABC transporter substrate-binding protein [Lachnospiraceae bacterium]|nr:ABC transporter substrate-binding protein [Lachnospiraceae bacterium]
MTRKSLIVVILCMLCVLTVGCGLKKDSTLSSKSENEVKPGERIVVGFSQLGAESDWRSANTESMKTTFTTEKGYELIFEDGQQKQANQIMAIRTFIQQGVDYIVLAPVTETGWDTVLREAKDAGIPVIIVDRMVDVEDESLFTCWVGSDFELEGKKAVEWLEQYTIAQSIAPEELHIVNIQGTIGASAQIGRTKALSQAALANGWDLLAEVSGEFTQAKGREVMEALLLEYDNINVVYCENDNSAFGAIEALEAAGKTVGSDILSGEIMVISFDAAKEETVKGYVYEDKISFIAECNPLHGPRVETIIQLLEAGETPEKFSFVNEKIFCSSDIVRSIMVDGEEYVVSIVTQETQTQEDEPEEIITEQ